MSETHGSDRLVAEIVAAAGGQVVGRVRLQKIFYLLDRLGLCSGFTYEYHYYGPYSADLADAIEDAKAFGLLKERLDRRVSDGVPYSIFESLGVALGECVGSSERSDVTRALLRMQGETATVLELAATIEWLRTVEHVPDWQQELARRKGAKVEAGRVDRAITLLDNLGLHH
jgi:uncharacterized protein YwgA